MQVSHQSCLTKVGKRAVRGKIIDLPLVLGRKLSSQEKDLTEILEKMLYFDIVWKDI